MKHKFQDPKLKALAKRLVALDLARAANPPKTKDDGTCPGCSKAECCGTEYRSIADFGGDYGVSFHPASLIEFNNIASKETIRQGKSVQDLNGSNGYHPDVLAKVIAPVMAAISGV